MVTLLKCNSLTPLTELKAKVRSHLKQLPTMMTPTGDSTSILRSEFVTEPVDIFTWLHNQRADQKLYWSGRDEEFSVGGIGAADRISEAPDYESLVRIMEDRLSAQVPNLRYYGGIAFAGPDTNFSVSSGEWKPYTANCFWVPRFELLSTAGGMIFAVNVALNAITVEAIEAVINELDAIDFHTETQYRSVPVVQNRSDQPDAGQWRDVFTAVHKNLVEGALEKVVLARRSVFTFDKAIDPVALTRHLKDITPQSFHFCFQIQPNQGFLGASPERLIRFSADTIETEALAGTRARGETGVSDKEMEAALLDSAKDAQEHQFVIREIRNVLEERCDFVRQDENFRLLKLPNSQHLLTQFHACPKPQTELHQCLAALHPTPAVGGVPRHVALKTIEQNEPFERGWYAGPVGHVGVDLEGRAVGEFAVAIRSALVNQEQLSLFAGAGIVRESELVSEWNEIENKIMNFINVFTVKNSECPTVAKH